MDKKNLISIIIPTKNSAQYLKTCLESIQQQSYRYFEIILIDNQSTDKTLSIAKKFMCKIYQFGPERSAQVNFGVTKALGEFVYKVDSDFKLEKNVLAEAIQVIKKDKLDAIVVHNSPDKNCGLWAKVRKFETDMYKNDLNFSSARFIKKAVYKKIGGFDETIVAGEDYDFQNKLNQAGFKTGFIQAEAIHLDEAIPLRIRIKKYYQYGKNFKNYLRKNKFNKLSPMRGVFFKHIDQFLKKPLLASLFLIYFLIKYLAGFFGYLDSVIFSN